MKNNKWNEKPSGKIKPYTKFSRRVSGLEDKVYELLHSDSIKEKEYEIMITTSKNAGTWLTNLTYECLV
jgi:hypothetical protein